MIKIKSKYKDTDMAAVKKMAAIEIVLKNQTYIVVNLSFAYLGWEDS